MAVVSATGEQDSDIISIAVVSFQGNFFIHNADKLLNFRFGNLGKCAQSNSFEAHFLIDEGRENHNRQFFEAGMRFDPFGEMVSIHLGHFRYR